MRRFLTVTCVGALVIVGFILYQRTRPLMLPNNPERSQFLYEQALIDEDVAAVIRGLEADGVIVDPNNAFYQLSGEGDDAIETVVLLTESEHLVGFAFQEDELVSAFLAGEDDGVYIVDVLSGIIFQTAQDDVISGRWEGNGSLAEITTIDGPVSESPFYGIEFPEGYLSLLAPIIDVPELLALAFENQEETCDIQAYARAMRIFQRQIAEEANRANSLTKSSQNILNSVSNIANDIGVLANCPRDSWRNRCLTSARAVTEFLSSSPNQHVRHIIVELQQESRLGQQSTFINFLNTSQCSERLSLGNVLELCTTYDDSETASTTATGDVFINNTFNVFVPYAITTTDPSFEVTGYLANGEAVDTPSLVLPPNTQGGVEITARCPAETERNPEGIYEGLVIATPPVGEMAFLGIRLQCSNE
ncbi:MAG: hypothetical protein AAF708_09605 [Deinococcota bacterium]